MPTNEERREVAEKLRDMADCEYFSDSADFGMAIKRAFREAVPIPRSDRAFLRTIADLIEPEQKKFCIPDGYLIIPDPTKNPYDPNFQVDKFTSVEDGINAIANAVMRAEQDAIVMESLKRAGFAKLVE